MNRNKHGFTIIEVIATMVIIVIIMGGVTWNLVGIRHTADIQQAVYRATLLTTAKEVLYRELGQPALTKYTKSTNEDERFALIKPYLPYIGKETTLSNYAPEGFEYTLNAFHEKVGITHLESKQKIEY